MSKIKNYPYWVHPTKKDWLRRARKQWSELRKAINKTDVTVGSVFYPDEVYNWLVQFEKMDYLMKEYYKNA